MKWIVYIVSLILFYLIIDFPLRLFLGNVFNYTYPFGSIQFFVITFFEAMIASALAKYFMDKIFTRNKNSEK